YFVGIEKLEPHVQKKDVERRFQILRKVQLRNTAARFRFNALQQKYTTYLTYWGRICRRIEEGTYKRLLVRLQPGRPGTRGDDDAQVFELGEDEIESLDDDLDDSDHPTTPPPALSAPPVAQPTAQATSLARPAPVAAPRVEAGIPRATATQPDRDARIVEEFHLPFHDEDEPAAAPAPAPVSPPTPSRAVPPARAPVAQPAAPVSPPRPAMPAMPAVNPTVRRAGLSVFGVAPGARPAGASPGVAKPVAPPAPARPAMSPARPEIPVAAAPATAKPVAAPTKPEASPPARVPAPQPTRTEAAPAPAPRERDEVRDLYERYSQSRKQTGEGDVSFDAVAKLVRETLPRLAEKYPGSDVSLDVTVKDGRTVLRPVVKKK
ncbi:MAG: MXAN_5187 C-terminal domain-containing protein, partial [Deltaproteobacteria bacterium]